MPRGDENTETPGVSELRRIALAFLLLFAVTPALAQDWPTKTVRIVVPFGAGATPDTIARLIADKLQQKLGQNFIIENKPGASGMTGTDTVAKAEPDGYTIGVSIGGPLAINTLLFSKMPYDPFKDVALITMLTTQPSALAVPANFGINSVQELVADNLPLIPLVSPNVLVGARPGLGNFRPAILDPYVLWNADELFWRP